jgi:hypothetical protein
LPVGKDDFCVFSYRKNKHSARVYAHFLPSYAARHLLNAIIIIIII